MTTLTVSVPDSSSAPQATVRDWELNLVKHVAEGAPTKLAPGRYLVSLPSPGGEDAIRTVEIAPGEDATVVFGDVWVQSDVELETLPMLTVAPAAEFAALPWHARVLSGRDGAPVPALLSATDAGDAVDLGVAVQAPPGPTWVQLAAPGGVPRNVMLPDRWILRVRLGDDDVWATAVPPGDGFLAALAVYLGSGQVREAADLGVAAMELLRGKVANPIGATVGGYALLRMRRVKLMRDWPYNLSQWFDWLPDGAVIAAELALLQRRKREAAAQLERAAERGVPIFAEGLSLLGRRVREGLVETKPAVRLAALTPYMELGQLTVALPGRDPLDPARTQEPQAKFPQGEGWRSFTGAEEA